MALPDTLAARLIQTIRTNGLSGSFAMLGRQRWIGGGKKASLALFERVLEEHLPGLTEADLVNAHDIYSETFFTKLGFESVDSIDFSPFENASIIQDLSAPLAPELENRFDVIYDGGTCEHIFELATAYRNIDRMLKPGGVLIGHSPTDGWVNHGFYQICPEMVYGFWQKAMGYELIECFLQPLLPAFAEKVVTTTNPNETGKRPRLSDKLAPGGIMLIYAVRKPSDTAPEGLRRAYQTDYTEKWSNT